MPKKNKKRDLTKGLRERLPNRKGKPHKQVKKAKRVFDVVFRRALKQPDVVGVDIGFMVNESEQKFEDEVGIRFHVETKISHEELKTQGRSDLECEEDMKALFPSLDVVKKQGRIHLNGIPSDVIEAQYTPFHLARHKVRSRRPQTPIETDDIALASNSAERIEPLVGGVSVGRHDGPAGTLGLVVHDRTDGRPCILGNWHVLAGFDGSHYGTPTYQPAFYDGGCPDDRIAHLKRWVFDSLADAALAQLEGQRDYSVGSILGLWFPVSGLLQPWLGQRVKKWGRTTGFTEGFVDGVCMATAVPYGNVTPRHFENQIHLAPRYSGLQFSDLGDSGSVVVAGFPARFHKKGKPKKRCARKITTARNVYGPPIRAMSDVVKAKKKQERWDRDRKKMRVYYAVGMLFAGDTSASRFGEFALAHPMIELADHLGFSIQPALVPEGDMIPQLPSRHRKGGRETGSQGGGNPPQPVSLVAGARTTIGGPQPEPQTDPLDPGP